MFLPSRARLTSRCPPTPHARKLENPVIPTLLAHGTRHAILVQCVEEVVYRRRVGIRFYRFLLRIRFHTARVKSSPADDVVHAAEAPQKADQIAAAPRTEKVCPVSRVPPVQTALRNCTGDEGGPFGFGDQVADSKPPQAAAVKSRGGERCGKSWDDDPGRYGRER